MSLRCAVRGCDKEAEAWNRLEMKRINQEAGEALWEREWQSRARVQRRDHETKFLRRSADKEVAWNGSPMVHWLTGWLQVM